MGDESDGDLLRVLVAKAFHMRLAFEIELLTLYGHSRDDADRYAADIIINGCDYEPS